MTLDDPALLRSGRAGGHRVLTARGLRTRQRLVDAARQVFATIPFPDARLIDITNAAGTAAGTFYTYFDDKEEIFREVAASVLAELSAAPLLGDEHASTDEVDRIAASTRQYFLACLRNSRVVHSTEQLAVSDALIGRSRRATVTVGVKRAARWIEDLQRRGICDEGIDPWTTAMVLHTMTVRVAYDHLLSGGEDGEIDDLVDAVTTVWARTVGLERLPPR